MKSFKHLYNKYSLNITKPLTCSADTKPYKSRSGNAGTMAAQRYSCQVQRHVMIFISPMIFIFQWSAFFVFCLLSFVFKGGAVYISTTLYVISFFRKLFVYRKAFSQWQVKKPLFYYNPRRLFFKFFQKISPTIMLIRSEILENHNKAVKLQRRTSTYKCDLSMKKNY